MIGIGIGYWHDTVVCPSVRLSALSVTKNIVASDTYYRKTVLTSE